MFVASRVASTFRAALPYAQWAAYLIQLGYVGYNLYQLYSMYLAQMEQDARDGRTRSLDETIELVVKPIRKRTQASTNTDGNNDQENRDNSEPHSENKNNHAINNCQGELESNQHNYQASLSKQAPLSELREGADGSNENDDITIVYDSRLDNTCEQLAITDVDLLSNASTSLESTDSNKGILKDIYNECFICTRSLNDASKPVATLPFCMHPFHQSCLDGVLKWHKKCPVCDFHIFSPI